MILLAFCLKLDSILGSKQKVTVLLIHGGTHQSAGRMARLEFAEFAAIKVDSVWTVEWPAVWHKARSCFGALVCVPATLLLIQLLADGPSTWPLGLVWVARWSCRFLVSAWLTLT